MRFHLYDVLSKRTRVVFLGFTCLMGVIFLVLTRFYAPETERLLDGAVWGDDYTFEGLMILKTAVLMLTAFCGVRLWFYAAGDLALVQRIGTLKLTLSKVLASWIIVMIMMTLYVMMYWTIGRVFGLPFERFTLWSVWWRLGVFVTYYITLSGALAVTIHHMFSQFALVFGWFMSDVLIDMGAEVSSVSIPALITNALFINIHINQDWQLMMVLHGVYIALMMLVWVAVAAIGVARRDF